jgi:hypothetical protein
MSASISTVLFEEPEVLLTPGNELQLLLNEGVQQVIVQNKFCLVLTGMS